MNKKEKQLVKELGKKLDKAIGIAESTNELYGKALKNHINTIVQYQWHSKMSIVLTLLALTSFFLLIVLR